MVKLSEYNQTKNAMIYYIIFILILNVKNSIIKDLS